MKKLIKYLISLTVIVALSAAFMANTHKTETSSKAENPPPCWINPEVSLKGDCVKFNENANYVVHMTIVDICSNPNNVLYDSTKTFLSDNSSTHFCVPNQLCTVDQTSKCFVVYVTAIKKDNTNGSIICSGQAASATMNCEELMYFTDIIVNLN